MPVVGSALDIYEGIQSGDNWQVALGVGGLILDVVTLGSSSIIKGAIKTGVKQGIKAGVKVAAKDVGQSLTKNITHSIQIY